LSGERTDVTLSGATCICELFLNEGRMTMTGDEGTYNAVNSCTTVEVGHREVVGVPDDAPESDAVMAPTAELVMRNVTLGRFAPNDDIVGQITAHRGGRIRIEQARCARLKLITKGDGTMELHDLTAEGELERIEQGGSIRIEP
jgi:hypothetical protein